MITSFLTKRRRGAMAMVAVAAMVPVTAMMSANLNTSQMVNDRRIVQDGADALASMHGAWTARALNVISMNNVTTAQLLTVAAGSEALVVASGELLVASAAATAYITGHNVTHCTPRQPNNPLMWIPEGAWFTYCQGHHALVNVPAVDAAAEAAAILDYFKPGYGVDTATKALEASEAMNQEILARHPDVIEELGADQARLLGLTDFHFADPCDGFTAPNCPTSNSRHGMALPLEEESGPLSAGLGGFDPLDIFGGFTGSSIDRTLDNKYVELYLVMQFGTTGINTGFAARGFPQAKGPIAYGGGDKPHVRDHINQITGIGDSLNKFQNFYTNRFSDLPRYPYTTNPPNRTDPRNGQARQRGTGIINRSGGFFDFTEELTGVVSGLSKTVLDIIRLIPFSYDRHPPLARLVTSPQNTDGGNSYTRAFDLAHLTVAAPEFRNNSLGLLAPVPMMWRLKEMSLPDVLTAADPTAMAEPFHILAYGARDLSPRLSQSVLTSPVEQHTGYGQVGVYNPDGASLYSQSWDHQLMAATRMDTASTAGTDLARQASSSFAALARALQAVSDGSTCERVHAH